MIETATYGRDLVVVDKFGRDLPIAEEYLDAEITQQDADRIELLSTLFPGAIGIMGIAGSGKTTMMGWIAYWFEHYFDIHAIADFDIRPDKQGGDVKLFQNHKRIDDGEFLDEQEKMLDAIKKSKDNKSKERLRKRVEEDAGAVWGEHGINLHRKVILWDDVHKKFDRRRWLDPMTILYSHVLKEHRHYYSLILEATTDVEDLDLRATKNLTHEITSVYNPQTRFAMYKIWNRDPQQPHWERPLFLHVPDWWALIDSFQMTAPRRRMIGRNKEG